jgi:hypothetical protein
MSLPLLLSVVMVASGCACACVHVPMYVYAYFRTDFAAALEMKHPDTGARLFAQRLPVPSERLFLLPPKVPSPAMLAHLTANGRAEYSDDSVDGFEFFPGVIQVSDQVGKREHSEDGRDRRVFLCEGWLSHVIRLSF